MFIHARLGLFLMVPLLCTYAVSHLQGSSSAQAGMDQITPSRAISISGPSVSAQGQLVTRTATRSAALGSNHPAQTSKGSQEHVKVLANLPLNGMHVNQMFIQQRDTKFYLYLHRPTKEGFALVDVTNPEKPILLSRNALKDAPGGQVQPPADSSALALTVTPEDGPAHTTQAATQLPTETVQFVDMSDPKNAKTVKSFKGVTSVYPDDARKMVYLVNAGGLWIISHRLTRPMP
jgi:hypothetical protein